MAQSKLIQALYSLSLLHDYCIYACKDAPERTIEAIIRLFREVEQALEAAREVQND